MWMLQVSVLLFLVSSGARGYTDCIKQLPTPTDEEWVRNPHGTQLRPSAIWTSSGSLSIRTLCACVYARSGSRLDAGAYGLRRMTTKHYGVPSVTHFDLYSPLSVIFQFRRQGRLGFYTVEHSRCNNCENNENWKWMNGRGLGVKKMCWLFDVVTPKHKFYIPITCTYSKVEYQDCVADFAGTVESNHSCTFIFNKYLSRIVSILLIIMFDSIPTPSPSLPYVVAGKLSFSMTDNKHYVAGTYCLFGRENFWFYSAIKNRSYKDTLIKARQHFKDRGFTAPVAIEGVHPVVFKAFREVDCD
jgi:hypothetical protein